MFSPKACERLGHYVYLYIHPRTGTPFYVGKGQGSRCFSHLKDRSESEKVRAIDELTKLGLKPRIDILKYDLTEEQALLVESTAIDLLGIETLTNRVRGHGSRHGSRADVTEIAATLDARGVEVTHAVMIININRNYRSDMGVHELYDATRSAWKLGPKRERARYALSVHQGIVREVFAIAGWLRGGTTMKSSDASGRPSRREDRWEFVGEVAEDEVRKRYKGRSVGHYFKPGAQNPILYVNCDD